ncbi:MAG: fatty acid desaturase [Acidimicrobiia bacterium]|nr:fatty acid desaturase [Acidimicrobiia bacterium]
MAPTDPELADRIKAANTVARRHFGVFQWPTVALVGALVAAQIALIGATLAGPVPLMVGIVVLAVLQYPTYICFHETAHGNIARGRARGLNDVVGSALGVVLGVPLVAHRREHLAHHAYTNREGADPDRVAFAGGRFDFASPIRLFVQQYRFYVHNGWPVASGFEKARFLAETAVTVTVRVALIAAFGWRGAVLVVATPILGVALIAYLVVYLVHAVPEPLAEGRWIDTVSYETDHLPRPVRRLVDWGWMGHHVHGIHHLYPTVPFYRQQRVFEEIRCLMVDLGAPMRRLWASNVNASPARWPQGWPVAGGTRTDTVDPDGNMRS